jgi:hypothetical protein
MKEVFNALSGGANPVELKMERCARILNHIMVEYQVFGSFAAPSIVGVDYHRLAERVPFL